VKLNISRSAQKDLDRIENEVVLRISTKIYQLPQNPYPAGSQKLGGNKGYRIRISKYRVIYTIDKAGKLITITKVGHRKEVYR